MSIINFHKQYWMVYYPFTMTVFLILGFLSRLLHLDFFYNIGNPTICIWNESLGSKYAWVAGVHSYLYWKGGGASTPPQTSHSTSCDYTLDKDILNYSLGEVSRLDIKTKTRFQDLSILNLLCTFFVKILYERKMIK